ncbi:MAG: HNH endonuclease [Melioribacteraceae bacterium]|nr:HNH endonuclease [Melioribacteraceae bacterium]
MNRHVWKLFNDKEIPEGMLVLHSCDDPRCINAAEHLHLGTRKQNMAEMVRRGALGKGF